MYHIYIYLLTIISFHQQNKLNNNNTLLRKIPCSSKTYNYQQNLLNRQKTLLNKIDEYFNWSKSM
jgi:hypothetical protein